MTSNSPRSIVSHRLGAAALALAVALLASAIPFGSVLAVAPVAPSAPDLAAGSDTGNSNTDNITQTLNGLVFTGTAEANSTVQIYLGGITVIGTGLASSGGVYSVTTTIALADNAANVITATATNGALEEGPQSAPLTVTTDNLAPAAPSVPDLDAASDTGTSNTDNVTADTTPTFSGTSEANATVQLLSDAAVVGTAVASGTAWTITSIAVSAGTHSFTAIQTDAAGNGPSAASAGLSVTIDTAVPAAPSAPDLIAASDSGPSSIDNITNDTTPTFTGTATANTAIDLYAGATLVGSTTSNGSGDWTITTSALAAGTYAITAKATNLAGTSVASAALSVTIQTALTVTVNQIVGQADPTATAPINFTVTFNSTVGDFASGDVTITGTAGGTKTATVTGGPTAFNVEINGMTTAGTVIVTLAAGVATDASGNTNTASTSTDNTVTWSPGAPTVTINQATGQADPTATSPINFTVVFSAAVTGFTGSDVTITGTAGGTKTVTVTGSGTTYNAAVSGMTTAGTVIATVPAGGAINASSQGNLASTSTDNIVTWTPVAAAITLTTSAPIPPGAHDPVILWGQGFTLTVQFGMPGGGGRSFQLQGTRDGVTWTTITTLTTNANGRSTYFYTPVTNLFYRAVFAGAADLTAANSNQVRTVVRQLAVLRPTNFGSVKSISRNSSITFTTTVRPARPELPVAKVSFYFYRFSSGAYRLVTKRDVFIDSAGLARTTFKFTSSGQWYVRSQANPTTYNANSVLTPIVRYSVH
jgi:hypothetical protein